MATEALTPDRQLQTAARVLLELAHDRDCPDRTGVAREALRRLLDRFVADGWKPIELAPPGQRLDAETS